MSEFPKPKMKKLWYILSGYPRLSETFIAQEIHLLEQRDFDIAIISIKEARELQCQPVVAAIRAPVTYVPALKVGNFISFLVASIMCCRQAPRAFLRSAWFAICNAVERRNVTPLRRFVQAVWAVVSCAIGKGQNPDDHLHSHFLHSPAEMTLYISKLSGLQFSISAHAKDIYTVRRAEIVRRINASKFTVTCTRFNRQFLTNLPGVLPERVYRIYHGVDVRKFKRTHALTLGAEFIENLVRFVTVGRLVEKKGYDIVIASLHQLRDEGIRFVYDIYGSGSLQERLVERVRDFGLAKEVRFHGAVRHPEILMRLNQGGIFLGGFKVVATGDRDGIPNAVAEAMAMEMPVLATKVSSIPELIENGVSGHLVPPNDVAAFTSALRHMIQNPAYSYALAVQARKRILDVFNCECCIEDLGALFERTSL